MTAPHGPSEAALEALGKAILRLHPDGTITSAQDAEQEWLAGTDADRAEVIGALRPKLDEAWPLIVAEVRAAVVAEYGAALKAESNRRFRERTAADSLGLAFDGGIAEAADILLGIEKARAQLPPVSAPGPTLPSGWEHVGPRAIRQPDWGVTLHGWLDGRMTLQWADPLLGLECTFAARPLADLQAVLAYLASRAERGPDAGGEG